MSFGFSLLQDLDDAQKAVVETLEGPVVIYAGAGSGKTRALTYRIANGVLNKLFDPTKVLALSFTTRAADEMALRLASLGIRNVATRTFHSAALRQLKYFWPIAIGGTMPIIIENKYKVLDAALKNKKLKIREVISEIEFAKTNRMDPESLSNLDFADAYQDYINFTDKNNLIDFEDVLMLLVAIFEDRPDLLSEVQQTFEFFSVDEYQDVNPLQQNLLDLWLGANENICVVGDIAQTIYSFAGAKAKYLEEFPHKYPNAAIFRLNRNYRSSFEIVDFANSLLAQMPSSKSSVGSLFPTRAKNEVVKIKSLSNDFEEAKMITQEISQLLENGVEPKNIAVLSRVNAQLELLASQLESENIEFYMQTNERYSLKSRLEPKITLASIHATKGLEWDHVFVLGVSDGYLPFIQAETQDEINEELRLLYVATTRAKENLYLSWAKSRDSDSGERIISRFLNQKNKLNVATDETVYTTISRKNEITKDLMRCKNCEKPLVSGSEVILQRCKNCPSKLPSEYLLAAKKWRAEQAIIENLPEFLIFSDASLEAFVEAIFEVKSESEFLKIVGVDEVKFGKYFDELSTVLAQVEPEIEQLHPVDK